MQIPDTQRLSFSFVTRDDADFLWELDQDEECMRFINGGRRTTREEIEGVMLPRLFAYANKPFGWGLWKVTTLQEPVEDIGWILVRPLGFFTANPSSDTLELGWRFKRSVWGQGFASEAARAVRDALNETGVEHFAAIANPDNLASLAVMKKLGMTYSHHQHYQDELFDEQVVVYKQTLKYC